MYSYNFQRCRTLFFGIMVPYPLFIVERFVIFFRSWAHLLAPWALSGMLYLPSRNPETHVIAYVRAILPADTYQTLASTVPDTASSLSSKGHI